MNPNADEESKNDNEELDKKRKRQEVSSVSDVSDQSFNIEPKQHEEQDANSKYNSVKPKDKKKKRTTKADQTETETIPDFKNIEKRFNENQKTTQAIYDNMKKMNNKLDTMISKDELEEMFKKMFERKLDDIVSKVKEEVYKSISHRIDIVEGELHTTKLETDELKKNIKTLKTTITHKNEVIDKLVDRIEQTKQTSIERAEELEQYTRRNNIRINGPGLPIEKEGERETAEQTTDTVIQLLNEKMGITLHPRDIDIAHRIGVTRRQVPRPIIVKFVSRNDKIKTLKDKRTKLHGTGIYVQEDLTALKAKVLKVARESDKTESAWSKDGHIYIKLRANGRIEQIKPTNFGDWLPR